MIDKEGKQIDCDGINHHAQIDFVTFIQHPDQVWRKYAAGSVEEVRKVIAEYNAEKAPSVDIFVEYCCDKCKEASNG